eukprot:1503693-Ditylum_brightwellii.AAC.1
MEEMSKNLAVSQTMVVNRIANMFHMMKMQQSKTEQMIQKIVTITTTPTVKAKLSDDSLDDKALPSGFHEEEKRPNTAFSNTSAHN